MLSALVERGFDVLVPFGEGQPYDLVVHLPANLFLRVQCKTAREREGCVMFNGAMTDHGRGQLSYAGLADIFGVYFPPTSTVYLVPVSGITCHQVRLRLSPARNNQRRRIRLASEYELEGWTVEALCELARSAKASTRERCLPMSSFAAQ